MTAVMNCTGMDPEDFFRWESHSGSTKVEMATEALRACFTCPFRVPCTMTSLTAETGVLRHGIWGGTTPPERRAMVRHGVRTERDVRRELAMLDARSVERRVSVTKMAEGEPE